MFIQRFIFFRRLRLFLIPIAGLIVGIIVSIKQIDLKILKQELVNILQYSTNLPIEIHGQIHWKLSLTPKLEMNNIYIKSKSGTFFKSDKLDVSLNLFSIFTNKPSIDKVKLYNTTVYLDSDIPHIRPKLIIQNKSKYPFKNISFNTVDLENLILIKQSKNYKIETLHIETTIFKDKLNYKGWIKENNESLLFTMNFFEYDSKRKVYPVKLITLNNSEIIKINFTLEGTSKIPITFNINGKIQNLKSLGKIANIKLPDIKDINLYIDGNFNNNIIGLKKIKLNLNDKNDLLISGIINLNKKLNLTIKSKYLNLLDVYPNLYKAAPPTNRELNVFKDVHLFGDLIKDWNINVLMKLSKLVVYRDLSIDNLDLNLYLKDRQGDIKIDSNFASGIVNIYSTFNITNAGKYFIKTAGVLDRINSGEFFKEIRLKHYISGLPINSHFYLESNGDNLSNLMSNLFGHINMYSTGKGLIKPHLFKYMYGGDFLSNLSDSVKELFTNKKELNSMDIRCAGADILIRNGNIETANRIAVQTNIINLKFSGNLDLGKEFLDLSLITTPVRGIKLSVSGNLTNAIKFYGNLAEPSIMINGSLLVGKILSGAGLGILLTPITGGLSFIAGTGLGFLTTDLLDNWGTDSNPCDSILEQKYEKYPNDPLWLNKDIKNLINSLNPNFII